MDENGEAGLPFLVILDLVGRGVGIVKDRRDGGVDASLEEMVIHSDEVFSGRVIALRVDRVELPEGRVAEREVVVHPGAAAVVAVDAAGMVILVEQYRHCAGRVLLEIPAGKIDSGETPLDCAARELMEETGIASTSLEQIGEFFTSPGFSTEIIHLFLARGLEVRSGSRPDPDEVIRVWRAPLGEVRGMIERGEIRDAKSIAGLLIAEEVVAGGRPLLRDRGERR